MAAPRVGVADDLSCLLDHLLRPPSSKIKYSCSARCVRYKPSTPHPPTVISTARGLYPWFTGIFAGAMAGTRGRGV